MKKERIKQIKQDVTTTNIPISSISKESKKEEPVVKVNEEKPKPQNQNNNKKDKKRDTRYNNRPQQNRKPKEQKQPEKAANITVRSFKAKKKDA